MANGRKLRGYVIGFTIGATLAASGTAFATASLWRSESPYIAKVRCAEIAEDSAANVRLVAFDRNADGTVRIVYACKANGY